MTSNNRSKNQSHQTFSTLLERITQTSLLAVVASAIACSGSDGNSESGVGGASQTGGKTGGVGGQLVVGVGGGTSTRATTAPSAGSTGGTVNNPAGGATTTGNTTATGGTPTSGGSGATGGTPTSGGNSATGGTPTSGGTNATGGTATTGGASTSGGTTATGGNSYCALPSKFKWTSSAALAKVPRQIDTHDVTAIKDFTDVVYNNKHIVYATAYEGNWKSAMFVFDDWTKWDATAGTWFSRNAVAPTLVYFTPKKKWVLFYQWGFQYATSDDPTDVSKWSNGSSLLSGGPAGAIDQTFICDSANCYLFFAGDNGNIYRSSMPIGSFPSTFQGYKTILTDTQANLFEAVQVYTVKAATKQYLMIVEAMGAGGRYFRAFTTTDLGGNWTALSGADTEASPFAGKANVTGTTWSNDISHGDMVRTDPSETQTIDPCSLQFLYQGFDKTKKAGDYGTIPYQPGLLTLVR